MTRGCRFLCGYHGRQECVERRVGGLVSEQQSFHTMGNTVVADAEPPLLHDLVKTPQQLLRSGRPHLLTPRGEGTRVPYHPTWCHARSKMLMWELLPSANGCCMDVAPVTLDASCRFWDAACYLVLHIQSDSPESQSESLLVQGDSWATLAPLLSSAAQSLDPKSFTDPVNERRPPVTVGGAAFSFDVYVFVGKASGSLAQALALAQAWALHCSLREAHGGRTLAALLHTSSCVPFLGSKQPQTPTPEPETGDDQLDSLELPPALLSCPLWEALGIVQSADPHKAPSFPHTSKAFFQSGTQAPARGGAEGSLPSTARSPASARAQEAASAASRRSFFSSLRRPLTSARRQAITTHRGGRRLEEDSLRNSDEPLSAPAASKPVGSPRLSLMLPLAGATSTRSHDSQRDPPLSDEHRKADKLKAYAAQCTRITDLLSVGGDLVARDLELLQTQGITHVVNCAGVVCDNYFPDSLQYLTLFLQDDPAQDIVSVLYHVIDFIDKAQQEGGRVFIHCHQGVSRSCAVAIGYLIARQNLTYDDAYRLVRQHRGVCRPNLGFFCQLKAWCRRRQALHDYTREPRLYRIAPHSRVDSPDWLVALALPAATTTALDPRTVFVLHGPSNVFVWHGSQVARPQEYRAAALKWVEMLCQHEHAPRDAVEMGWTGASEGDDSATETKAAADVRTAQKADVRTAQKADVDAFWGLLENPLSMPPSLSFEPDTVSEYDNDYQASMPSSFRDGSEGVSARYSGDSARATYQQDEECDDVEDDGVSEVTLFQYPDFESLPMFDSDDLYDSGCYVLALRRQLDGPLLLHVWLGEDFDMPDTYEDIESFAASTAAALAAHLRLAPDSFQSFYELSGSESDAFWDGFTNG